MCIFFQAWLWNPDFLPQNWSTENVSFLCARAADIYLFGDYEIEKSNDIPGKEQDELVPYTLVGDQLEPYSGCHRNDEHDVTYKIKRIENKLFLQFKGNILEQPLDPVDEDCFEYEDYFIQFIRNDKNG